MASREVHLVSATLALPLTAMSAQAAAASSPILNVIEPAPRGTAIPPFQQFDLAVMDMRQHLPKVAHIHQRVADRAIPQMIKLGLATPSASTPL
jgi:hypothetical protein